MGKQYGAPENYEAKLERVMERLKAESYDYDWSRRECWVEFQYKGGRYRFAHSLENAEAHGVTLRYGSDAFAQVVLSLEDLARMVERGIYDLSTWVAGMKLLPEPQELDRCFVALGFSRLPSSIEEVREKYRRLSKAVHPDAGGDAEEFRILTENYEMAMAALKGEQND